MIAHFFNIPIDKVEQLPITTYRELLGGCFNISALESGMGGFEFQTDEEKTDELDEQIEYYRKQGFKI